MSETTQDPQPLAVGDTVVLKSGGAAMTIVETTSTNSIREVMVAWFCPREGVIKKDVLPERAVESFSVSLRAPEPDSNPVNKSEQFH